MHAEAAREIDQLVREFFALFDNRESLSPRLLSDLDAIFTAGVTVVKKANGSLEQWNLESFISPRRAMLSDGTLTDFHEWEAASQTAYAGGIACRVCHYKKQGRLNGEPFSGSGVKSIHMVQTGAGWRITSILWEDHGESDAQDAHWRFAAER